MKKRGSNKKQNLNTVKKNAGAVRPPVFSYPDNAIHYPKSTATAVKPRKKKPATKAHAAEKSRKTARKQKNRRIAATVVLVSILIAICVFISLKVLFVVRKVEVTGSEKYTAEEISAYCAIPDEINIFKVDTESLEKGLTENFTYIEKATVERKLPDKILITITDGLPTYYSRQQREDMTTYTIYSRGLKQLTQQSALPEELMQIDFDINDRQSLGIFYEVCRRLERQQAQGIKGVSVSRNKEISLNYENRVTIQLGTHAQLDYKLKMALHILQNDLEETEKGVIDASKAGSAIFKPSI